MSRITDDENAAHRKEKEALKRLLACEGWTYLVGRIGAVEKERIQGLAGITSTATMTRWTCPSGRNGG